MDVCFRKICESYIKKKERRAKKLIKDASNGESPAVRSSTSTTDKGVD